MSKSAVMVFARESVDGAWKWGEHVLPRLSVTVSVCQGCCLGLKRHLF